MSAEQSTKRVRGMNPYYKMTFSAWILWNVLTTADPSGKQMFVQVWIPEGSFAKFEFCQDNEYRLREIEQQDTAKVRGVLRKYVCMPDTFVPPPQEPARQK